LLQGAGVGGDRMNWKYQEPYVQCTHCGTVRPAESLKPEAAKPGPYICADRLWCDKQPPRDSLGQFMRGDAKAEARIERLLAKKREAK
jgi:hypothetical protein